MIRLVHIRSCYDSFRRSAPSLGVYFSEHGLAMDHEYLIPDMPARCLIPSITPIFRGSPTIDFACTPISSIMLFDPTAGLAAEIDAALLHSDDEDASAIAFDVISRRCIVRPPPPDATFAEPVIARRDLVHSMATGSDSISVIKLGRKTTRAPPIEIHICCGMFGVSPIWSAGGVLCTENWFLDRREYFLGDSYHIEHFAIGQAK